MRNYKGITLVSLVITIIVMLILVGVTVTVTLNGELFNKTKEAAGETQIEKEKEQLFGAVAAVIGADAKVDFNKLDNKLPQVFEKIEDKKYKSKETGKIYLISEAGNISLEEDGEEDEIVTSTYKVTLAIEKKESGAGNHNSTFIKFDSPMANENDWNLSVDPGGVIHNTNWDVIPANTEYEGITKIYFYGRGLSINGTQYEAIPFNENKYITLNADSTITLWYNEGAHSGGSN